MAPHKKTSSPSSKALHKKLSPSIKNRRMSVHLKRLMLPDDVKTRSPPLSLRRTRRQTLGLVKPFLSPTKTTYISKPVLAAQRSPQKPSRSRLSTAKPPVVEGTKTTRSLRSQLPSSASGSQLTITSRPSIEKNRLAPEFSEAKGKAIAKHPKVVKSAPGKSPVCKSMSPARKCKPPANKSKPLACKSKSPLRKAKSPAGKSTSPPGKSTSSPGKSKSPPTKSKSPPTKSKSPPTKSRSPPTKSKSRAGKSKSRTGKRKSPAGKSKSLSGKSKSMSSLSNKAEEVDSPLRMNGSSRRKSQRLVHTTAIDYKESAKKMNIVPSDIIVSPRKRKLSAPEFPKSVTKKTNKSKAASSSDLPQKAHKSPVEQKTRGRKSTSTLRNVDRFPNRKSSPSRKRSQGKKLLSSSMRKLEDKKLTPSPKRKLMLEDEEEIQTSSSLRKLVIRIGQCVDKKSSSSPKKKLLSKKVSSPSKTKSVTPGSKLSVSPRNILRSSKIVKQLATPSPRKGTPKQNTSSKKASPSLKNKSVKSLTSVNETPSSTSKKVAQLRRTPSPDVRYQIVMKRSVVSSSKKSVSLSQKPRRIKMNATSPAESAVSFRKTPMSKRKVKDLEEEDDLGSSPALPSACVQLQRIRESTPLPSTKKMKNSTATPTPRVIHTLAVTPTPRQALKKIIRDNVENQMDTVITKADVHKPNTETYDSSDKVSKVAPSSLWTPNTPASLSTIPPTPESSHDHRTSVFISRTTESRRTLLNFQGSRRSPSPSTPCSSIPVEVKMDSIDGESREENTIEIEDEEESLEEDAETTEEGVKNGEEEEEEEEEDQEEDDGEVENSEEEEPAAKKSNGSYCVMM